MKKSLILSGLIITSSYVFALDTQYFMGIGAEKGQLHVKHKGTTHNINEEIEDSSSLSDQTMKIKAGLILNDEHRISLSNSRYGDSEEGKFNLTLLNYDYIIPNNSALRLYAGFHLGGAQYKEKIDVGTDELKMSGLAYGVQIGTLISITNNIELDLGASITRYDIDKSFTYSYNNETIFVNKSLDYSTSLSTSLNYKF